MTETMIENTIYYSTSTKGFYNSQIHKNIPDDAIAIDETSYQSLLNGQAKGQIIASDETGKPILQQKTPPSLVAIKSQYNANIDRLAETARMEYITAGDGQALTYLEKANQALDYSGKYAAYLKDADNNPMPDEQQYPLLTATIGIDGATLLEVAENITLSHLVWQKIGAKIEAIRLKAKIDIAAATTTQQIEDIFNSINFAKL